MKWAWSWKADVGRDPGDRLAVEQAPTGGLDPPGHQVLVGGDAEGAGEGPDQVVDGPPQGALADLRVVDRPPGQAPTGRHHAKIVQDRAGAAVVHCRHGLSHHQAGVVSELLALAGFTFVASVTPGPNNTLLWASGIQFGFRRTARHVAGTAVGMGVLLLAMAGGVGALLAAVPGAALALKLAGSAYLLVLAWRIARSGGADRPVVARPLGLLGGAAFQFANPKAWLFALAAVGTFQPPGLAPAAAALTVAALCAVVILATAAVWAAGGAALTRVAGDPGSRRAVAVALGLVLAASVAFIWV